MAFPFRKKREVEYSFSDEHKLKKLKEEREYYEAKAARQVAQNKERKAIESAKQRSGYVSRGERAYNLVHGIGAGLGYNVPRPPQLRKKHHKKKRAARIIYVQRVKKGRKQPKRYQGLFDFY